MAMSEVASILKEIRLLCKRLVERLIPVEELLKDEKEAIESRDEVAGEKELMEALN
jgi:hypothetical protein